MRSKSVLNVLVDINNQYEDVVLVTSSTIKINGQNKKCISLSLRADKMSMTTPYIKRTTVYLEVFFAMTDGRNYICSMPSKNKYISIHPMQGGLIKQDILNFITQYLKHVKDDTRNSHNSE